MPVIDYATIKQSTMDSLRRYAQHHIPTGGFLQAVLENNLMQACGRADEEKYRQRGRVVASHDSHLHQ